jgi:sugar porter (SP) family MFS transporter
MPNSRSRHFSRSYVYLISVVAAVGGLLFGYNLTIISGAVIFLQKQFSLTAAQLGFAIGSLTLGCISGPLMAGWFSDRFGRKKGLLLSGLLLGICAAGTATAPGIGVFNVYRIIGGIGVGMVSVVSPMYIAEVAPARLRGSLVTLNQLGIVVGEILSIAVSYFLSFSGNWRGMFASALIPSLILIAGLFLVPESPRWLVQKSREKEAMDILARLEGQTNATMAIQEIKDSAGQESGAWSELLRPGIRMALLIAVTLGLFSQWTGVSPMVLYAPIIFQKAGFTIASDALLQTLVFYFWNFICTVAVLFVVDRVGRRPLLLLSTAGMVVGQLLMGTFFHVNLMGIYVVAAMFLCLGSYAIGLAPVPWLIMAEVFPSRIRAKGQSAAALCLWLAAYSSVQATAPIMNHMERKFGSPAGVFWIFALICAAALLFEWRMVPETKGKSIEEIGKSWIKGLALSSRT